MMRFVYFNFSLIIGLFLTGCFKLEKQELPKLKLVSAMPVETNMGVELSGLVWHDGSLYSIADKHDYYLFEIVMKEGAATLNIARRFNPPERGEMDWEGLSVDYEGNFYLASEAKGRIAKLAPGSSEAEWVSPSVFEVGQEQGLFAKVNAGVEGLIWLGEKHWLMAAEREPRGVVEYRPRLNEEGLIASVDNITRFGNELSLFRLPDYAGLTFADGYVWALFRNAHLLVRLEKGPKGYSESSVAYSYKHVENDYNFAYTEDKYGQAEGVAWDGSYFYIVLDNNLSSRKSNSEDRRPLLFVFELPK